MDSVSSIAPLFMLWTILTPSRSSDCAFLRIYYFAFPLMYPALICRLCTVYFRLKLIKIERLVTVIGIIFRCMQRKEYFLALLNTFSLLPHKAPYLHHWESCLDFWKALIVFSPVSASRWIFVTLPANIEILVSSCAKLVPRSFYLFQMSSLHQDK